MQNKYYKLLLTGLRKDFNINLVIAEGNPHTKQIPVPKRSIIIQFSFVLKTKGKKH